MMYERLLNAAIEDNVQETELENLTQENSEVLFQRTRRGNTCFHIASLYGHTDFCTKVLNLISRLPSVSSLLSITNNDLETPMLVAVKSGHVPLARYLITQCNQNNLNDALLTRDTKGCTVLHHAIRNRYDEELALDLISQQPGLPGCCNDRGESPMFIAVMRGLKRVYMALLNNETSTYTGARGYNAMHAAVKYDNEEFVQQLVDRRSQRANELAAEEDEKRDTPMHLAAHYNRAKILEVMLRCDRSLGYLISTFKETPLLFNAASRGHVAFARALLEHCPDAPYCNSEGRTCLHEAVEKDQMEFVEFILDKNSKLRKLVNLIDNSGDTALHLAVKNNNPEMVSALLGHPDIDITIVNGETHAAIWELSNCDYYAKNINWNKICGLIMKHDSRPNTDILNLHKEIKDKVIEASRKDARSLIQTYTGNTSLVAILIATITFAAAFTLPGGYSSAAGSEGLPIMSRKHAFQAFLIFDTLGMLSSLAVAFICVIARWMDFEFLLHYRFFTKKLMWLSYMATTQAFATGLYTVLDSRLHWLAITICVLSALLPILTMLIGEWPILKLKIRYTQLDSSFLDMV